MGNASMMTTQKIGVCLWFDDQAEEAVNFYASIFKNSKIGTVTRYGPDMPGEEGTVMTIPFEIEGQQFLALNGGPVFQFSPAISLIVNCESQAEIDEMWERLSEGGATEQCGWLKDKYGVSWQIVPADLDEMLRNADAEKVNRIMNAVLKMEKIDLALLQQAAQD
jgi:predicted 3-demethylubiquinone-9 3-methyltransferase (glyoxalase superfamily)